MNDHTLESRCTKWTDINHGSIMRHVNWKPLTVNQAMLCLQSRANTNNMGRVWMATFYWLTKDDIKASRKKKNQAIWLENSKCAAKQMRNTWEKTEVNVFDRAVRNCLKEMGFTSRKGKWKPSLTHKQKKKLGYNELKKSNCGLWMPGWKMMNLHCARWWCWNFCQVPFQWDLWGIFFQDDNASNHGAKTDSIAWRKTHQVNAMACQ